MSGDRPVSVDQEVIVMELPPQVGRQKPEEEPCPAAEGLDWRVDISNDDLRDAKRRWLAAHDGGAPDDLVDLVYQDYVHLISAQAQQFADDLRRR